MTNWIMPKPKRMSDIFASSAERAPSATSLTATPPYSSEGPTLPIIGGEGEHGADCSRGEMKKTVSQNTSDENARKKRKTQAPYQEKSTNQQAQLAATSNSLLYEPWTLLPHDVKKCLNAEKRLRGASNIVPVVFTKNQNVKSGINRLKTYLGAYVDKDNPMDMPDALKQPDSIIAVSTQGEGATKLVSIVDMTKRVVAPSKKETESVVKTETWWTYISLTSIDVEKKAKLLPGSEVTVRTGETKEVEQEDEEEAFEPMDVDSPAKGQVQEAKQIRKVPVLTVWMTKLRVSAFKDAFGEQSFTVELLSQDDD
jgi:hypothetical protein